MIELYQASWYQLVFPIEAGGEPVASINDAKLVFYQGSTSKLELTLSAELSFSGGSIYATLDEIQTIDLLGKYAYELWIVDFQSNPIFVRAGDIKFLPTKARF